MSSGGGKGSSALRLGYGVASLVLIGLYPFLPPAGRSADILVVYAATAACVVYGRRSARGHRRPWTLLLWALAVLAVANIALLLPDERVIAAGRLVDAVGNLLVLAAALALIIRRGTADLGGVIDAAVIAFAAGSLLWVLLPHRLGPDQSFPAQVTLFVVVFALTGVLGALLRLAQTAAEPGAALWWLLVAISLALVGNIVLAIAGPTATGEHAANMLFLAAFSATGLFGLDPSGPRLMHPQHPARPERLSTGRLVFLGVAVAVIPVIIGTRELLAGDVGGLLLAAQGALVAVLVMARIGLLSAQRARAEQALEHQAAHDPLTYLPNRRELVTRLRAELSRGVRCVLLFCDLDDFKRINDQFGHDQGDALLIEVARRLRLCVGPPNVVSRFGGDEFVVLLIDATLEEGQATGECILAALRRPFAQTDGVGVGVSIGIADAGDERDAEQLIRSADRAMYRAKPFRGNEPPPVPGLPQSA